MEAPEKIYIVEDRQKHEPMEYWYNSTTDDSKIEYTRTDAFIKKACEWLQKEVVEDYAGVVWEGLIEDFKKHMEG